jgi:hypothetical protein
MVTNFKEQTKPLTELQLKNIEILLSCLKNTSVNRQIPSYVLVELINSKLKSNFVTNRTIRKLVNHIRCNGIAAVIGTSSGYYISSDVKEISEQIKSLTERANSIFDCVYGLNQILKSIENEN